MGQIQTTRGEAPGKRSAALALRDQLNRQQDAIRAVIPAGVPITTERICRSAMLAVRQNSDLQRCSPETIIESVVKAASLGLDPGGALGEAYLVPYGNRCQLIPGYQGMISIARRSGVVRTIRAHTVCEADEWEYTLGLAPTLIHKPSMRGDRGAIVAVYAVADLVDGGHQFEVMSTGEVDAIRTRSRASHSGPWKTDYGEMAKKTVVRRLFKYLPKSLQMIELIEQGDSEFRLSPLSVGATTSEPSEPQRERESRIIDVDPDDTPAQRPAPVPVAAEASKPAESASEPVEADPRVEMYEAIKEIAKADRATWERRTGRNTLRGLGSADEDTLRELLAQSRGEVQVEPGPPDDSDDSDGADGELPW